MQNHDLARLNQEGPSPLRGLQSPGATDDDIQRNLLRVMAVTSGSWNLVATSRMGRRLASRNPQHPPRRALVVPRRVDTTYTLLPWAW